MLGDVSKVEDIYLICGHTDMRKSIDGLAALIKLNFGMDPSSTSLAHKSSVTVDSPGAYTGGYFAGKSILYK